MTKTIKMPKDIAFEMIIQEYSDDIKFTILSFIRKSTMPEHLYEDLHQEALLLLFTRLDRYDPSLSGIRTFTVRTTEIACLRFRQDYYKLATVPTYILEQEDGGSNDSIKTILDNLGVKGRDQAILQDRVDGFTLLEISAKHDISVNRIYELVERVGELISNM